MDVYNPHLGFATPDDQLKWLSYDQVLAQYQDYADLGAKYVRIDLRWQSLQKGVDAQGNVIFNEATNPNDPNAQWTEMGMVEKMISAAKEAGLEVIGIMGGSNYTGQDSQFQNLATAQAYGNFAQAVAERFADDVQIWEVLNEPNKHGIRPNDYVDVLIEGYNAIKSVSADNVVLFGGNAPSPTPTSYHPEAYANGFWGSPSNPEYPAVDFLEAVYARDAGDYFDGFAFHPYSWPLLPSESQSYNGWTIMETEIRDLMVANGDGDKQIWLTEMGVPTSGSSSVNQQLLIDTLNEVVEMANEYDWMGPVIWYTYKDRGLNASDTESFFGIVDQNGNPKAAYYEFMELGQQQIALYGHDLTSGSTTEPPVIPEPPAPDGTIHGTESDNTLNGTSGNDLMYGHGGNDALNGGAGNDTIHGGWGNDTINGGAGNDILYGEGGNDIFVFAQSNNGFDVIADFNTGDKIDLRSIDANMNVAGIQAFTFIGSAWLTGPGQIGVYHSTNETHVQIQVSQNSADDIRIKLTGVFALTASDFLLGAAQPVPPTPPADPTIHGTEAANTLTGTAANDLMYGHGGNDILNGGAGTDTIHGGWGNDTINGDAGNDLLYGEGGNDIFVFAQSGNGVDTIADFAAGDKIDLSTIDANMNVAGIQAFTFIGGAWLTGPGQIGVYHSTNETHVQIQVSQNSADDIYIKLAGNINLTANDFILGAAQPVPPTPPSTGSTIHGSEAANTLNGTAGNDLMYGHGGNDILNGGAGNDTIHGGWGNDTINGGAGNDILYGEGGNDTFVFNAMNMGNDTIMGFQAGDKIDLSALDANEILSGNQAFDFIFSNWLQDAGDLGFYKDAANNKTYLQGQTGNVDGASFSIILDGLHDLTAGDIIL